MWAYTAIDLYCSMGLHALLTGYNLLVQFSYVLAAVLRLHWDPEHPFS